MCVAWCVDCWRWLYCWLCKKWSLGDNKDYYFDLVHAFTCRIDLNESWMKAGYKWRTRCHGSWSSPISKLTFEPLLTIIKITRCAKCVLKDMFCRHTCHSCFIHSAPSHTYNLAPCQVGTLCAVVHWTLLALSRCVPLMYLLHVVATKGAQLGPHSTDRKSVV